MKTTASIILRMYTLGEATIEETNIALEEIGSNLRLNPNKNVILPCETKKYGLLNSGWGSLDKVAIENLALKYDDMGDAPATCYYMGKLYKVEGKKLIELR